MRDQKQKLEGLLLVNKPPGITSHDVVDCVRRQFKIRKVGHAGTLDPLAEGLLIILVGRYTKFFSRFVNFDKEYLGVLKLGEVTTTGDSQGTITEIAKVESIDDDQIRQVCRSFLGTIQQVPPMVSAIRLGGKRLYELARKGVEVARNPRQITIYKLEIRRIDIPFVELYVKCSKGTYIRKLAEDIGQKLGCGAHITNIKRLAIGPYTLEGARELEDIKEGDLKAISCW